MGTLSGFNNDAIPEANDVVRVDLVGGFALQKVTSERSYFRWVLGVLKHNDIGEKTKNLNNLLECDGIYLTFITSWLYGLTLIDMLWKMKRYLKEKELLYTILIQ